MPFTCLFFPLASTSNLINYSVDHSCKSHTLYTLCRVRNRSYVLHVMHSMTSHAKPLSKKRREEKRRTFSSVSVCICVLQDNHTTYNIFGCYISPLGPGLYFWYLCVSWDLLLSLGPGPGPITQKYPLKQASVLSGCFSGSSYTHISFNLQ